MNAESDKFIYATPTSKIPTPISPFKRSSSFKVRGERGCLSSSVPTSTAIDEIGDYTFNTSLEKTISPLSFCKNRNNFARNRRDEDLDSIGSVASNFSVATNNSYCEHVSFAKNGTTFSGKTQKYIVHCSDWNEEEKYLTPTQRANRSIRKLKSLLQLAKEKLREKEEEIFKLNLTVNELKLLKSKLDEEGITHTSQQKASVLHKQIINNTENISCKISECDNNSKDFSDESLCLSKMSLSPSQNGFIDKSSITSDFLLCSSGDSGNFDDLTSTASVNSKTSHSFINLEGRHDNEQTILFGNGSENIEAHKMKLITMYEKKLMDKKVEYELELNRVINEQEEKNIKIISNFEEKLKQEELKFEIRWNELLKTTEEEKLLIVNRFEEKLEEEKKKYMKSLHDFNKEGKKTDNTFESTYSQNVEEERTIYETSLISIKKKFENEKLIIEKKFDNAMKSERDKFEDSLKNIQEICDSRVAELTQKVSQLKLEYNELLPKYEEVKNEKEELKKENEILKNNLKQQEECHKKFYLTFLNKEQVVKLEDEGSESNPQAAVTPNEDKFKKMTVPELSAQLKITEEALENLKDKEYRAAHSKNEDVCLLSFKEAISLWMLASRKAMYKRLTEAQAKFSKKEKSENDPEATLQFLKSAIYYFLTDKENHIGHLKAIESILAFSSTEKSNIEKVYLNKY